MVRARGKDLIYAANLYELNSLKHIIEMILVEDRVIEFGQAVSWFVFADSMTLPLMKEYALKYIVARADEILAHESCRQLEDSLDLYREVAKAVAAKQCSSKTSSEFVRPTKYSDYSVDSLRVALHERGLDVDGCKDTLIARLNKHDKKKEVRGFQIGIFSVSRAGTGGTRGR